MSESEHDPFNERDLAHPRARELLVEEFFWEKHRTTGSFRIAE